MEYRPRCEGFINELKLLKRQGYGRANFDLLRAKALAARRPLRTNGQSEMVIFA